VSVCLGGCIVPTPPSTTHSYGRMIRTGVMTVAKSSTRSPNGIYTNAQRRVDGYEQAASCACATEDAGV